MLFLQDVLQTIKQTKGKGNVFHEIVYKTGKRKNSSKKM